MHYYNSKNAFYGLNQIRGSFLFCFVFLRIFIQSQKFLQKRLQRQLDEYFKKPQTPDIIYFSVMIIKAINMYSYCNDTKNFGIKTFKSQMPTTTKYILI